MGLSRRAGLGILVGACLAAGTASIALAARDYITERTSQIPQNYSLEDMARARVEAMERASELYNKLTPEQIALGITWISGSSEEISPYHK